MSSMNFAMMIVVLVMPFYEIVIKDVNEDKILSLSTVMGYQHTAKVVY